MPRQGRVPDGGSLMARDFGHEAQQAAEKRLEDILHGDESEWCGCTVCLVREVLTAAWPAIDAYCEDDGKPPLPRAPAPCPYGNGPDVGGNGEAPYDLPPDGQS